MVIGIKISGSSQVLGRMRAEKAKVKNKRKGGHLTPSCNLKISTDKASSDKVYLYGTGTLVTSYISCCEP